MTDRILIAQTGFLGDVVLTTGLVAATRARFARAKIALLTSPPGAELMADQPPLDRVLVDDKRGENRCPRGWLRLAAALRAERFTLALIAHKSPRTALLLAAAGIPRRVGFSRWPQALLYHERVPYRTAEHYACRQLALLHPLGGAQPRALPQLSVSEAKWREANNILHQAGVVPGQPLAGVCPGSAWATKRWPAERYGALVRALAERGFESVILGGKEDEGLGRAVVSAAGGRGRDLTGKTRIGVLPALLQRMDIVVTNDSAPLHVASALGRPLVAIFCSTSPSQGYAPLGPGSIVVGRDLDCRPCGRHGGRRCPLGTDACRVGIEVAEVAEAVQAALGALAAAAGKEAGAAKVGAPET